MHARFVILLALCLIASGVPAAESARANAPGMKADAGAAQLAQRIAILRRSSAQLDAAASQAAPKGITAEQQAQVRDYDQWLRQSSNRLEALANQGDKALRAGGDSGMAMSFNLQYLQLQSQMQHENRSYTAVSNIMKTKHDTMKNSISNIR